MAARSVGTPNPSAEDDLCYSGLLDQIFAARARTSPARIAVVSNGDRATYAEIEYRSGIMARRLSTLGVAPNALVALLVERGVDLIVGMLGILKAGGAYLPIDASTPAPRIDWLLRDSGARVASVWEIWGALLFGGRLVVVPDEICRSPSRFRELLRREHVTVLNQTPTAFGQLDAADRADAADSGPADLRLVILGGERLNPGILAGWMDRRGDERPVLVNMYGLTEATVHASIRPVRQADLARPDRSPIGVPLPDLRFHVLNEAGELAAANEPGELHISGAGLSPGYLNRQQTTAERFFEHPVAGDERVYRTGDRVAADQDGQYYYLGRLDDQIKLRGYRIEPREVEAVLETHPGVAASVVVPHDYGDGDVRLVAYLVPGHAGGDSSWAEDVRAALAEEFAGLPSYLRPSAFVPIPALPLTVNGKVDRFALPAPLVLATQASRSGLSATQARVAAIWAEVLNSAEFRLDEDFFDLGGTSLTLIRMLDRVNASFGTDIDVAALIDEATVASLAVTLESAAQGSRASASGGTVS